MKDKSCCTHLPIVSSRGIEYRVIHTLEFVPFDHPRADFGLYTITKELKVGSWKWMINRVATCKAVPKCLPCSVVRRRGVMDSLTGTKY